MSMPQLLLQLTSPRLTFLLQRGGGNRGGGDRRPDRRAPPPARAPRRDEGPRDGVRKVRISIGAIPTALKPMASANLRRCRTLLFLRDPSVLARMRHPSAPAHHPMLLEPCDINQQRRTRTNEHETDSDLRAYRTDAMREATSMGKDETCNEEGGHPADSESATGYTIATKKTALAVAAVVTKTRTPTTDGLRRGAHLMSRLDLNTLERTTADSIQRHWQGPRRQPPLRAHRR
jgi:hypothetical protein